MRANTYLRSTNTMHRQLTCVSCLQAYIKSKVIASGSLNLFEKRFKNPKT